MNSAGIIKKTFFILDKKERFHFFFIIFFSLLIILLETLGLTSFYYAISFIFNKNFEPPAYLLLYLKKINILHDLNYANFFFLGFIILYFLRIITSIIIIHFLYNFIFRFKLNISNFLSKFYLEKKFIEIINKNDAYLISNITDKITNVGAIVTNINLLFVETLFIFFLTLFLLFFNFNLTLIILIFSITVGVTYNFLIKKKIKNISVNRQIFNDKKLEIASYLIKSIKDIKVFQNEGYIFNMFKRICSENFRSLKLIQLLQAYPRFIIEIVLICSTAILYLYAFTKIEDSNNLANLALFVVAFFRFIPTFNKILFYINNTKFYLPSLNIVYLEKLNSLSKLKNNFKKIVNNSEVIKFEDKLSFQKIYFSFNKKKIFENLNLNFYKNRSYAIIGPSGSGKSTLINILTGILRPQKGFVKIDGIEINKKKNYLSIVAFVPQEFNFLEGNIKDAISFGLKVDNNKITKLVKTLKIFGTKKNFKLNKLLLKNTKLLSVGQKQKVAIARALYKEPEILVFDEPTSALDKKSVVELVKIIKNLKDKTIIVVTHDLKFAKYFDHKILLT